MVNKFHPLFTSMAERLPVSQRTAKAKARSASWRANTSARTRPLKGQHDANWETYDQGRTQMYRATDGPALIAINHLKRSIKSWDPNPDFEKPRIRSYDNQTNLNMYPTPEPKRVELMHRKRTVKAALLDKAYRNAAGTVSVPPGRSMRAPKGAAHKGQKLGQTTKKQYVSKPHMPPTLPPEITSQILSHAKRPRLQ